MNDFSALSHVYKLISERLSNGSVTAAGYQELRITQSTLAVMVADAAVSRTGNLVVLPEDRSTNPTADFNLERAKHQVARMRSRRWKVWDSVLGHGSDGAS